MSGIANKYASDHLIDVNGQPYYKTLADCINENSIYDIRLYKGEQKETYSPVWSYTRFTNEYQKIGITEDKIMIRIKEV